MGIFAKIKKAWFDTIVWETIDDEFYDELEDSLIMADLGATVAHDAVKSCATSCTRRASSAATM